MTVIPVGAAMLVCWAYASTWDGSEPLYSVQPIRLRASEKPIAIATELPSPTATEIASAWTVAWISEVSCVVIDTAPCPAAVPVAVRPLSTA